MSFKSTRVEDGSPWLDMKKDVDFPNDPRPSHS
jgi:hypothetical protein